MNSPTSIQTFTGIFFDPFNPRVEDVRIEDIAHALTMQCRFGGHVRKRWSVAQHSLMVSDLCPEHLKLEGLLHDASEAYLTDLPRPIKHHPLLSSYRGLEADLEYAISKRFDLSWPMPDEIKAADNAVLVAEAIALKNGIEGWQEHQKAWGTQLDQPVDPTLVQAIRNANPPTDDYIKEEFLRAFHALGGE